MNTIKEDRSTGVGSLQSDGALHRMPVRIRDGGQGPLSEKTAGYRLGPAAAGGLASDGRQL
jgi:hypothetical protein